MPQPPNKKIVSKILEGLEALEAFKLMLCHGKADDESPCPNAVVCIFAVITGEHEVAAGAYCYSHIGLLSVFNHGEESNEG